MREIEAYYDSNYGLFLTGIENMLYAEEQINTIRYEVLQVLENKLKINTIYMDDEYTYICDVMVPEPYELRNNINTNIQVKI